MTTKIFRNPTFKTKIIRGVFINQDLVVFPQGRIPDNLSDHDCLKITGASYVLDNVETLNADWVCEVTNEQF